MLDEITKEQSVLTKSISIDGIILLPFKALWFLLKWCTIIFFFPLFIVFYPVYWTFKSEKNAEKAGWALAGVLKEITKPSPSSGGSIQVSTSASTDSRKSSGRSSRESKETQKPKRQPMYNARAKQQGQGSFVIELRDGSSCKWTKSHSGKLISGPDVAGSCINYIYEVGQSRKGVSIEIESRRVQTYPA